MVLKFWNVEFFGTTTSFHEIINFKFTYGIVEFVVINVVIGYDVPLRLWKKNNREYKQKCKKHKNKKEKTAKTM